MRGSPVTGTRRVSSPNADSRRPRTSSDAAGSTLMRCCVRRYSAPSTRAAAPRAIGSGLAVVTAASSPIRFSGMPCQSCTITPPVAA